MISKPIQSPLSKGLTLANCTPLNGTAMAISRTFVNCTAINVIEFLGMKYFSQCKTCFEYWVSIYTGENGVGVSSYH